ncbi:MAG: 3-oxoadipate enol-lactonase [Caldilineaceae bacterium]
MFTQLNGLTLHYQVEGVETGIPLVFINSLGSSLCIWDDVCDQLRPHFRIVRYDKRGHGLSDSPPGPYTIRDHAADLLGLLDHLQVEKAILIGVSVGGMIALEFAATRPQRVGKLVLCDTGAKIGSEQSWNERIAAIQAGGLTSIAAAVLARWFTPAFIQNQPAQHLGYTNMFVRMPAAGYIATCAALRDADLHSIVAAIQTPSLVLCGDQDMSTPPALGQKLAALLPNAHFRMIPNAAHLPSIEQPQYLAETIAQFLTG